VLIGVGSPETGELRRALSILRLFFVLMLLLVTASQFFVSVTIAEVGEDEDASGLIDAEEKVILAYLAVLDAENAGANVSSLLVQLNEAGEFLARAHVEYRLGNFEEASHFADSSRNIGVGVQNAAVELKDLASREGTQHMLFTMIASVVGVASIALGSLLIWYFMKKHYSGGFSKANL